MSYLDRIRKRREAFESGRDQVPSSVSQFEQITPDQSGNIFSDKMNEYRDKLEEQATAPFTTVGGVDLIRRGVNKIPAVQEMKDLFNKGGEFADKMRGILGDQDVQKFINDPESVLGGMADDLKSKVLNAVNEGIDRAKGLSFDGIDGVGDQIKTLGSKVGDMANQATQVLSKVPTVEEATQLGEDSAARIAQAGAQGLSRGLFGGGTPAPPPPQTPEEDDFDARFKADLNNGDAGPPEAPPEAPEEYYDAVAPDEGPVGAADLIRKSATESQGLEGMFGGGLGSSSTPEPGSIEDVTMGQQTRAEARAARQAVFQDLKSKIGSGLESAQDTQDTLGGVTDSLLKGKAAAAERAKIAVQEKTSDGLTEAMNASKAEAVDPVADSMTSTLAKVGGEEAPEIAAGLGVADAIPVVGTLADIGSIGAIVGEAVNFYQDKKKEAQAEAKEQARQAMIQKDISVEQSELVQQGKEAAADSSQQARQVQQSAQPIPITQSGFDPK